jgi:hypothetical protein
MGALEVGNGNANLRSRMILPNGGRSAIQQKEGAAAGRAGNDGDGAMTVPYARRTGSIRSRQVQ